MNRLLIIVAMVMVMVMVITVIISTSHNRTTPTIIEPFTRQFFNQIIKTRFLGIDQAQLFGNEWDLIQTIKSFVPFYLNTLLVDNSLDRFRFLNDNRFQLILARSNEIHDLLNQISPVFTNINQQHLRYVCALYKIPVNILSTVMDIDEFDQLRGSKLTVNVGPKDSSDYFIAVDLLIQYRLIVGQDICLSYYDINQLFQHYGRDVHIALFAKTHPDTVINRLVNIKLSRLVEIKKYNDGNIHHMSLEETDFYKQYPYYSKMILEKDRLRMYYPNLVINEWTFNRSEKHEPIDSYQSRFVNTIGLTYYLLSNSQTDTDSITQLLYNMKLNMNLINRLGFLDELLNSASLADFTMNVPMHPGAREFFERSGLITNINNPGCLLINGRCTHQQLIEHQLEHNFGPTFDQMFNQ